MGLGLVLLLSSPAVAGGENEPDENTDLEVVVEDARSRTTASSRTLDAAAVEALPARSADDLLRAMPGLHQSAHGGHGKADQFFLRGFDAVHGADLAVDLEGVPVNEVSNVHAHGYLDLHFLPEELVSAVEVQPGAAAVDGGDFAVAGAAHFRLGLAQPGGLVKLGGGTDRSAMATLAWRPEESTPSTFLLADAEGGQGVGMGRDWRMVRAGAGHAWRLGTTELRAWALAYDGVFGSPGALREDDLLDGTVAFLDAYPGSGGGRSTRVLGAAQVQGGTGERAWTATAWSGWRALSLQQNFTGWLGDAVHGDGTRQDHEALSGGASARGFWSAGPRLRFTAGAGTRVDRLEQGEVAVEPDGQVWERRSARSATQASAGGLAGLRWTPRPWLELEPGLRGDAFLVAVDGQAPAWAPVVAPRFRSRVSPAEHVDLFLSYGRGYRSPQAQGVGDGGRAPLATADTGELGATVDPAPWLALRAAGFATHVSDEIVFDHVSARYLATGQTRRLGLDTGATLRPLDALRIALDLTWSEGRYVASEEPIPYAPRLLAVAGIYAEQLALGQTVLSAGLRAWALGPRPLPEGFQSRPVFAADLTSTLRWRDWGVEAELDNVLGTDWRDGEFLFPSHWDRTEPRSELAVRHVTAGSPRVGRLSVSRSF